MNDKWMWYRKRYLLKLEPLGYQLAAERNRIPVNTLRTGQNGCYMADDICVDFVEKYIFVFQIKVDLSFILPSLASKCIWWFGAKQATNRCLNHFTDAYMRHQASFSCITHHTCPRGKVSAITQVIYFKIRNGMHPTFPLVHEWVKMQSI